MTNPIDVGVLGATGMVGQQFVQELCRHPWFRLVWLGASERSAGKKYQEATAWRLPGAMPADVADRIVEECTPAGAPKLVFSGLDAAVAGEVERSFAESGRVIVSNARNYRMDSLVPLLVPEINSDHLTLLAEQRQAKEWSGAIVTNPNCSTVVLALGLAPLLEFGLKSVIVATAQAVSGAGYPGVASLDIIGNIIPEVPGEEQKMETETQKIFGQLRNGKIQPHDMALSAATTRVPVINGHIEMVSVELTACPEEADVRAAFERFRGRPQYARLPSAPARPVVYLEEALRPQPRLDADRDGGMAVTVGRLRPCGVLDYKFVVLGHNTIRGAAGAAILNAEMMQTEGLLVD